MAWIVGDSFDYYNGTADVARSVWDSATTAGINLVATATRFGGGQKLTNTTTTGMYLQKTVASNEATLYAALAYYRAGALSGTNVEGYLQYRDGATAQCTVCFQSGGDITLRSGGPTGTVLATYAGAFTQDVWTHFQIRVVIDGAAGSMTIRKNGQTSDTYASATNLNTRGGTANNYANVVLYGNNTVVASNTFWIDDLLFFSGSGAAPNTWVGDVRAVCLPAAADTAQKQFTPLTATGTVTTGTASSAVSMAQNTVRFTQFTPARSGVLAKATLTYSAAYTGSAQVALYDNTGTAGAPGALLGTSAVVVNPASGANDFTFTGGPTLAQGRTYYLAYNDNIASAHSITAPAAAVSYTLALAFASGFPNPAGAVVGAGTGTQPYGLLTLSGNVSQVSEALANGDTDYVFDATVNDADLYDMDDLQFTPMAIVGVVSKIYCKKSDAGTRQGQILVKSGTTQVAGADTVLGTTYTYLSRVDAVDPNTGAAWTTAALNAMQIGQKVTL